MGWSLTADLDEFLAAADGSLRAHAAENIQLLSAAQDALDGKREGSANPLYGWWAAAAGTEPRGAFLHDPPRPLLIVGRSPENAAVLAAQLARAGRSVSGVDAPAAAADAFAAAWSQRDGAAVQVHRSNQIYRLTESVRPPEGPPGHARPATWADRRLLVEWLRAFGAEVGDLARVPESSADELLGYRGAALWEDEGRPVSMAIMTRPVASVVRVSTVYTPPEHRGHGYGIAIMIAVSRAALVGRAREVVLITDLAGLQRRIARLRYELIEERSLLSFGPPTGPIPRSRTGPMPRLR